MPIITTWLLTHHHSWNYKEVTKECSPQICSALRTRTKVSRGKQGHNSKHEYLIQHKNKILRKAIWNWAKFIGHQNVVSYYTQVIIQSLLFCIKKTSIEQPTLVMWKVLWQATTYTRLSTHLRRAKKQLMYAKRANLWGSQPWKAVLIGEFPPRYPGARWDHCSPKRNNNFSQMEKQPKLVNIKTGALRKAKQRGSTSDCLVKQTPPDQTVGK